MAESDAEWIDFDKEFGSRRPQGPNHPPPRPQTTTTFRPRATSPPGNDLPRPRIPNERRPRRPFPRGDAPEQMPPTKGGSYKATTISVSVVSVIFLLALVSLLLYLFVLRKKLKKVQKSQSDSQFCLRVEDVTHIDIDDSAKLYVNTTDLQKLVSSVRIKNKKAPPAIPTADSNYPDVVKIGRSPAALPTDVQREVPSKIQHQASQSSVKDKNFVVGYTNFVELSNETIYSSVVQEDVCNSYNLEASSPIQIARPAPPPPIAKSNIVNKEFSSIGNEEIVLREKSKPPPPVLPKPTSNLIQNKGITPEVVKPLTHSKPTLNSKPRIPPPNPPTAAKPTTDITAKPLLPRLKMNLSPAVNRQDSGFSTPDTAISFMSDASSTSLMDHVNKSEPEKLSIKDKMALMESAIASVGVKRN